MFKLLFTNLFIVFITTAFSQENPKCEKLMLKNLKNIDSIGKPNYQKAIKGYSKILKIDPNFHKALYNRGLSYYAVGELDLALKDYNKCINVMPTDDKRKIAQAHTNRGIIYSRKNEFEKAIKDFNKALEIDSEIPQAYYGRAKIYKQQNDLKSACENLNKAMELGMKDFDDLRKDCQ